MARILVIDDDPFLLRLLDIHLSRSGHQVVVAPGAVEGLRFLIKDDFDAVVTDVEMPYLSGLEVAQAIRGDPRTSHLPILMLTTRRDEQVQHQAAALGALHVGKPVAAAELLTFVEKLLSSADPVSGCPPAGEA